MVDVATPIIFSNGTSVYDSLAKEYVVHSNGFFILAPSGSGKAYFVASQPEGSRHWIDGDVLWPLTNADPTDDTWESDFDLVQEINARSDIITHQAKKLGFWVTGSSNLYLRPDAIVLPPWRLLKQQILQRQNGKSDGGVMTDNLEGVEKHRNWIAHWEVEGVPRFESIQAAATYLQETIEQNTQ